MSLFPDGKPQRPSFYGAAPRVSVPSRQVAVPSSLLAKDFPQRPEDERSSALGTLAVS